MAHKQSTAQHHKSSVKPVNSAASSHAGSATHGVGKGNGVDHSKSFSPTGASDKANSGDGVNISPRAQAETQKAGARQNAQDSVDKFRTDLADARTSADNRKGAISDLEGRVQEAKTNGADEQQVKEMEESLNQLKEEQKGAEAQAADLEARLNALKDSGQLSPEQLQDLEGQLNGLKGVNGENTAKLDELSQALNDLKKQAEEQKAKEEKAKEEKPPEEAGQGEAPSGAPEAGGPHGPEDKKGGGDWDKILTMDAIAVLQAAQGGQGGNPLAGGAFGNPAGQGFNGGIQGLGQGLAGATLAGIPGTGPVGPAAGLQGAPGLGGAGASPFGPAGGPGGMQQNPVAKLATDYVQAKQSNAQLKQETEMLVQLAFQVAGVDPQALLAAAQNGGQKGGAMPNQGGGGIAGAATPLLNSLLRV